MPTTIERTWAGDLMAMGGRQDKRSLRYQAFVPDRIAEIDPEVTFEAAELALLAEEATRKLNSGADGAGLEAIGPLFLRSEATASSRIEGYRATSLNVARALLEPDAAHGAARTIARNIEAMREAIAIGDRAEMTVDDLLDIRRTLMQDEPDALPGEFRATQGWIGGRAACPIGAAYTPPPEDREPGLIDDLLRFMARDDIPPIAMAAIAHAQLETIHPFADGNGRVGRCLIHAILRRADLTPLFVPLVSIVLAARPENYIAGLMQFREGGIGPWKAATRLVSCSIARCPPGHPHPLGLDRQPDDWVKPTEDARWPQAPRVCGCRYADQPWHMGPPLRRTGSFRCCGQVRGENRGLAGRLGALGAPHSPQRQWRSEALTTTPTTRAMVIGGAWWTTTRHHVWCHTRR